MEKTLLYRPTILAKFNKSPIYAAGIFSKVIALSARYLVAAIRAPMTVAITDFYIEKFWQLHFSETSTTLYVTGREKLKKDQTYIFMSNHESWMDIPAMFAAVPTSLRMVSKLGLMKVPFLGKAMINAGFIFIDRKNRHRAIKQLEEAKNRLREGISIWMAPEGTRTRDGSIAPFKKGGFHLAKELNVPIVPVFIEGAANVMPADSMMVKTNQAITVHFCEPVHFSGDENLSVHDLVSKVRTAILEKKEEINFNKGA